MIHICMDCGDVWDEDEVIVKEFDENNNPVWQCFDCFNVEKAGLQPFQGRVH